MKHFKQLTLIILTFSLLLCGCGGTQANGTNDNTENNSTQENENNNSVLEKNEYTLSEYLSSGETIWFLTDGYGKDDEINKIFVIEPNGTLYYATCDWTLGEAEQKEDADIISYVKQTYEKDMNDQITHMMGVTVFQRDHIIVSDMNALCSPYLENITPAPYKLSITSDASGNNTENEVLVYQDIAPLNFYDYYATYAEITSIKLSQLPAYESDKGSTNCYEIYDSWYGGYDVKSIDYTEGGKDGGFLLTRINSSKLFQLDEIGTSNIGIDNSKDLFEEVKIDLDWECASPGCEH